ncbi:(R)-mandelonitrile lyase [Spirosoma endophyticum]|uniref:Cupin domain protein n=1 Tax=Spirosoma endophyticum TaxID=662367 RepID=A0A1I1F0S2_9BACT|nr:cupin domain-containing protein [Spirosoma endophyticum]SFB90753.1 Cupin domain protein [Spirosoma endophyticum]
MKQSIDNKITYFTGHPTASPQLACMALHILLIIVAFVASPRLALGQITQVVTGPQAATRGPAATFTGTVWVTSLVPNDSIFTTVSGSVAFTPGARSFWHSHPTGQILIVTDGVGYHQIKGEPKQLIRKGDVVKCPPNVVHWHGASPGSKMTHLYIIPNTEKGIVNWLQPVTDAEYNQANKR